MKDHEIAQLVNALRDCAVEFHNAQQLRERIAALVVPALRGVRSPEPVLDRHSWVMVPVTPTDAMIDAACYLLPNVPRVCMDDAIERAIGAAPPNSALQQSSSGITAGAEKPSQVIDFGAVARNRTADLLITNQDKNTSETSQNQDVTPKTAPARPAQVAPTESIGCEGVTAGLERYIDEHIDWLDRLSQAADYEAAREPYKDAARDLLTRFYEELQCACADTSRNAPWLTLAHNLCADAGVPSGHIADRIEALRAVLESRA